MAPLRSSRALTRQVSSPQAPRGSPSTGQTQVMTLGPGPYGIRQLVAIAEGAGWKGDQAALAAAIAMAESGGNPRDRLVTSREDSRGLWQINTYAWKTRVNLWDPIQNAAEAYRIYRKEGGFRPWSTYTNGAYRKFLPAAQAAVGNVVAVGGGQGQLGTHGGGLDVPDPFGAVSTVEDAVTSIAQLVVTILNPTKWGTLVVETWAWVLRLFWGAVWKWVIAPAWHATEKAVYYYLEVEMADGNRALITVAFWGLAYAAFFSKVETPRTPFAKPSDTPIGKTIRAGRDLWHRQKLHSPKQVEKVTPKKPTPTLSSVPLDTMRELATSRRRSVRVTGREKPNGTRQITREIEQTANDAGNEALDLATKPGESQAPRPPEQRKARVDSPGTSGANAKGSKRTHRAGNRPAPRRRGTPRAGGNGR